MVQPEQSKDLYPDTDQQLETEAVYELEIPARCSGCREFIVTVAVIRLLRTQVNFTSTLPRRGYLAVCPNCHVILPVDLGGLLNR